MAHSAQINVNGVLTTVTEFDNSAQAIDDAVSNMGAAATPQAALSALGAGVRPRLGINMDFQFNQRGQTSYTASGKTYTVDGWYLSSTGMTCAVGDGQVTITPNGNKYNAFVQILEQNYAGGAFTFSALASGASGQTAGIAVFDNATSQMYVRQGFVLQDGLNLLTVTAQIPESSPGQSVILYPNMSNGTAPATFYSAKPEEEEGQTLAYQDSTGAWHRLPQPEDGDYAAQLLECQRYQLNFAPPAGKVAFVGTGFANSATNYRFLVPTPVQMRVNPTCAFNSGVSIIAHGTVLTVTQLTSLWDAQANGVVLSATVSDGGVVGETAVLAVYGDQSGALLLSAQL